MAPKGALSKLGDVHVYTNVLECAALYHTAPLSTVGVDLGIWKYRKDLETEYLKQKKKGAKQLRSVTFYTWDFGGQVSLAILRVCTCMYIIYNMYRCMCKSIVVHTTFTIVR